MKRLVLMMLVLALLLSGCESGWRGSLLQESLPVTGGTDPTEAVDPTEDTDGVTEPTEDTAAATDPVEVTTEPTEDTPAVTDPVDVTTEPAEEVTIQPAEPEVVRLTLSFVGDCTFGKNQKHSYSKSFDDYYDQYGADYFFQKVRHFFENDDLTVVNLEGSLTTSTDIQDKTYNHKGDPEYVQVMTGSSVEVATMGNNHRLDYGQSGCDETMQVLTEAGVGYCFDDIYLIQEVKGVKVGFVSVNGLAGWVVESYLKEGHAYLREQGCQIVVACIHWGGDKTPEPEDYQKSLGHKTIDMGFDLVIGHHPHVLQGMELYNGKMICYSLGNFCYGGSKNPADKDSGIFQQTFTLVDGVLQADMDARFIPCTLSGIEEYNDYQPTPAQGERFTQIIEKMNGYNEEFGFALNPDGTV